MTGKRVSREVRMVTRPDGPPRLEDFEVVETEVPALRTGQVLVENHWMSVDPSTRVMMLDGDRPWTGLHQVGQPVAGYAVGRVIESAAEGHSVGDALLHGFGWRELAVLEAAELAPFNRIDADTYGERAYLGALGWPGLTAYLGLERSDLHDGDVVFVSAATGGVGALVVQLAKRRGHRVIGSAGNAEKVAYLRDELGVDAAFCYRDGDVRELIDEAAPEGIDLYFDLVGGGTLKAAISRLNFGGRITLCGAISTYNETERPCGPDLFDAIAKALTIRGFGVGIHGDRFGEMRGEMGPLVEAGEIVFPETVVDGVENAPQALIDLLSSSAFGKLIVKVA